jgi:DNA-binding transcriptional ArsR family regulator
MDIFSALADPTRRNILEVIAKSGQISVSEISGQFKISAPAVSQHLQVLLKTNLVQVEKRAQQRIYQINPEKVEELEEWAKKMKRQWEDKFRRLDRVLEAEKRKFKRG